MSLAIQFATTTDNVRIACASLGDGPPLVFASNMFGELEGYRLGIPHARDITDRLVAGGWRVIRYDVRGMSLSDRNVEDLSLDGRVRDLEAVIGYFGLGRFALSGLDVGAATAVAYAASHPDAVTHLILISPWASGARYFQLPALRAALSAEAMAKEDPRLFSQILGSVGSGFDIDPDLLRLGTAAFLQSTTPEGFSAFNAATKRIDLSEMFPHVHAPTLVMHEPAFQFGSQELCQEVAASIPGAEFLVVNDDSITGRVHDETVAAIDGFLRYGTATRPVAVVTAPHGLTAREVQVLQQVAAGSTNKEISAVLGVAVSTVERHLANLYTKIGARGRADAIAYALRHRLA